MFSLDSWSENLGMHFDVTKVITFIQFFLPMATVQIFDAGLMIIIGIFKLRTGMRAFRCMFDCQKMFQLEIGEFDGMKWFNFS